MFSYDNLENFYKTNFNLIHHHKYSLTEIENMMPWERFLYLEMIKNIIKEQAERLRELESKARVAQTRR